MKTIFRVVLTIIFSSFLLPLGGVYGASTTSTMAGKVDDALGVGVHRVDVAPPPKSLPSNSWSVREAQKTISVPKNQVTPRLVNPSRITTTPNTEIVEGGVYRAPNLSAHPVTKGAGDFVDLTTPARRKHILDGDATGGGHRPGTGKPGKSEFPAGRPDDSIIHDISDIATDPALKSRPGRGGRTITDGTRNGVDMRVIQERNGDIVTGFPTNTPRNPR